MISLRTALAAACVLFAAPSGAQPAPAPASAPTPDAMATQPDSEDFITRSDTNLTLLGNPLRFGGLNISWLALRDDTGKPADAHTPTEYEVKDMLNTALAMGVGYIRVLSLGASAGCGDCLINGPGQINAAALKFNDHLLKLAHDSGLKIIVPLAGPGTACKAGNDADPVYDTPCIFAAWRGRQPAEFFTDAQLRADFTQFIAALLNHLNPETGIQYKNDPTIFAWENCDGCGGGVDTRTLADWTDYVGQSIKAADKHHLYENGAFAGRLGKQPDAPGQAQLALPSVDIVADRIDPKPDAVPGMFADALNSVIKANRVYVIDSYAWSPAHFPTVDALTAFQTALFENRTATGAFVSDMSGHADQGGFLPPARPDVPALYFPGFAAGGLTAEAMQDRARAVRRFSYKMEDLMPIAFANVDQPEVLSAEHGKLRWRGVAGALKYSVERTNDVIAGGSWQTLCDQCVGNAETAWQDKSVPTGSVWYRVTPYNANLHAGLPSDPAQNK